MHKYAALPAVIMYVTLHIAYSIWSDANDDDDDDDGGRIQYVPEPSSYTQRSRDGD